MNHHSSPPDPDEAPGRSEEELVRRLIERAGRRPEVPAADLAAIRSAFRASWEEQVAASSGRSRTRLRLPLTLAASLLLALAVGWWWSSKTASVGPVVARVETLEGTVWVRLPGEDSEASGEPYRALRMGQELPAGAALETGGAAAVGRVGLRLVGSSGAPGSADATGPSLRLQSGSRVRLADVSVIDLERGALYVDSGREPAGARAVAVHTPIGVARDIGTQFEVSLVEGSESALRVRVREGEVSVEQAEILYRASAGEELTLHADGTQDRRAIAAHDEAWAWILELAPRFEGETLEELLEWVARETGWEIRYEDEQLRAAAGSAPLEGAIPDQASPDTATRWLPAWGVSSRLENGVLTVSRQ